MVKKLYCSMLRKKICPWCGKKWLMTAARRSIVKIHGKFDLKCVCGKEWTVIVKNEGYSYVEK